MAAATVLVLAAAYLGVKHYIASEGVTAPQSLTFNLDIKEQDSDVGPPVFQVRQGDRVTLKVRSPRSGELFVHGLEEGATLTPGSETKLAFTAESSGRYYIHFHGEDHSHTEVAVIEVAPR